MSGHDHDHAVAVTTHRGRILLVLVLTSTVLVVEVIGAIITGSLALLADAGHMLTDVAGLVMALITATLMTRPASSTRTWGWRRAEILGAALRLGRSEMLSGGRRKTALLGDAMEAVIAAVYRDAGLDTARALILRLWGERVAQARGQGLDAKTALQEWAQSFGRPLPEYRIAARSGSDHAPTFTVEVSVEGIESLSAQGRSRQDAEKAAATAMLKREGVI